MQLKKEGIESGKLKSKVDVQNAINSIRLKRDDISWMSINMKGTNIIVKLAQADKRPTIVNPDEYCNIVATKKGIIQKISADTGTILVKPGDIVEKGTILIGGYMEGKYTDTRYVHAKGKVTAKKAGSTTIKAKVGKKTLKCKIAVKESSSLKGKTVKEAINIINNWYIGEVWNNFVDFQSYRLTGLNCTGSKIDINYAYKNFKKSYKLKEEYDVYIACLDSNYSEIKDTWSLMKKQIEIIYADLEENGVKKDGSYLDLDLLSQYSDRLYNLVYEL